MGLVPADASGRVASAPNAGAVGEAIARTGAAAVSLGGTIADVQDEFATSKAFSQIYQAKAAIDQKYRLDLGDPNTAVQRYTAELQQASAAASSGIMQPRNKLSYNDMVSRFVIGRGADMIAGRADSQIANTAVAGLMESRDNSIKAYGSASDALDREAIATAFNGQVDAMTKSGVLSGEGAYRMKKDFVHQAMAAYIDGAPDPQGKINRFIELNGGQPPAANTNVPAQVAPVSSDDYRAAIVKGESGGDVSKVNPKSGAAGKYQFTASTAAQYGLTPADLTSKDPAVQAKVDDAFNRFTADNRTALTASLGRPPTPGETALAHQQGAQGAAALLANPDASAVSVVGQAAVLDNGGTADMTAGQFAEHVENYYGLAGGGVAASGAPATTASYELPATPEPGSPLSRLPADEYNTLRNGVASAIKANVVQQNAMVKAQQSQAKMAIETYEVNGKQQMLAHQDNPNLPPFDLLGMQSDPQWQALLKANPDEARATFDRMVNFQDRLNKGGAASSVALKAEQTDLPLVLSGKWTQKDIDTQFSAGAYDKNVYDFLTTQAKRGAGGDGKRVNQNMDSMLKMVLPEIEKHPSGLGELDIQRETAFRFKQDLAGAVDTKMKAGEDPNSLLTYGSKDYFGSPTNLRKYVKTYADYMNDAAQAQVDQLKGAGSFGEAWKLAIGSTAAAAPAASAAASTPKEYDNLADLQAAFMKKEISAADAAKYALAKRWAQ